MNIFRKFYTLISVCALLTGSANIGGRKTNAATFVVDDLSAPTLQELAIARAATAKYHDVDRAIADGYINVNDYESGEGFHFVKPPLIDATFNPDEPEILLYAPVPNENRLELVAVEYVVPLPLSATAPEGFSGDADQWRVNNEHGVWEMTAWIWLHNTNGMFAHLNPRVP
ncbi:MAG TPA: hypothetical protein VIX17_05130 [Pyrinomonadaceae bacterium]